MQKCLTLWALTLCSALASLHAQHSVKHSLAYETSGVELMLVTALTEANREFEACTPAPRPGSSLSAHVHHARSGSATVRASRGAAVASAPQSSCAT